MHYQSNSFGDLTNLTDGEMGTGGDVERHGEERVHLGDGEDQKNWGEAEGRETEMVQACEENGRKLQRQKNDEN